MPWNITSFTKKLHLSYPIIQAPMAGECGSPPLIASVSNFDALGSLAAGYLQPDALDLAIALTKKSTPKAFFVNFFIQNKASTTTSKLEKMQIILHSYANRLGITLPLPTPPFVPSFEKQMEVFLDHNLKLFSFTFGLLEDRWIRVLKDRKVILIGTATSQKEALLLEKTGVDFIVCQGKEAGGHRGSFIEDSFLPTYDLLTLCLKNVKVPLIAAGGIMGAKDITRALQLGASAVQMGSVFLTTTEAGTHPLYKKALLDAKQAPTVITRAFTGKHARSLNNLFIEEMNGHKDAILDYPIQHAFTTPLREAAKQQNILDYMSLWAGERSFLCQDTSTIALLENLVTQCHCLSKKGSL